MTTVWERIDAELARRRKTWAWLSSSLGYSEQRVNNWKRRGIPASQHGAIADALGRSINWVARGVEDGQEDKPSHRQNMIDPQKSPSFPPNESTGLTRNADFIGNKSHLIPVTPQLPYIAGMKWEQLMKTILKGGLGILAGGLWVEVGDTAMGPDLLPSDQVFFQSGIDPEPQDDVLVRDSSGELMLRRYRKVTNTVFEVWAKNEGYGSLRSDTDGIEVLAVVMERKIKRRKQAQ